MKTSATARLGEETKQRVVKAHSNAEEFVEETKQRVAKANSSAEEFVDKHGRGGFLEAIMPEKIMRVKAGRAFAAFTLTIVGLVSVSYFFNSAHTDCPVVTVKMQDPRCSSKDMWMFTANEIKVASFLSDTIYGSTYSCDPNTPQSRSRMAKLKDLEGSTPDWETVVTEWSDDEQAVPTAVALKDATTESLELKVIAGSTSHEASCASGKFYIKFDQDVSCDLGFTLDEDDDSKYANPSEAAAKWLAARDKFGLVGSGNDPTVTEPIGAITVDEYMGFSTSVAVTSDNKVVISYYDSNNYNLKLAICDDAQCSNPTIKSIDSESEVEGHTSVAVTSDNKVVISYQTYEDLKLALNFQTISYSNDNFGTSLSPSFCTDDEMLAALGQYFKNSFSEQLATGISAKLDRKEAAVTFKQAPAWIEPSSYAACTENVKLEFEDSVTCSLANLEILTKKLVVSGAIDSLTASPTQPKSSNGFREVKACPIIQDSIANTLALTSTKVKGVDLHKILRHIGKQDEIEIDKFKDNSIEVVDNPISTVSVSEMKALKSEFKELKAKSEQEVKKLQAKLSELEKRI
ncbi:hypothetical protein TrST_g10098 [Triparma strigata]|uniref:Uncharacterized protein n=1 Tax=Triparma strigata TaxID=1606541 RepID=A0A9W7A8N1_9STRA|nr:hypothetical protein TrST_g10098 [Triparma strigata]